MVAHWLNRLLWRLVARRIAIRRLAQYEQANIDYALAFKRMLLLRRFARLNQQALLAALHGHVTTITR